MADQPPCFLDWMKIQLEKSLAAQPDDKARIVHLAKAFGDWTARYPSVISVSGCETMVMNQMALSKSAQNVSQ